MNIYEHLFIKKVISFYYKITFLFIFYLNYIYYQENINEFISNEEVDTIMNLWRFFYEFLCQNGI